MNLLFTSFTYLAFLALGLCLCFRFGYRIQNGIILALSIIYYASFGLRSLPFMALVVVLSYIFGGLIAKKHSRGLLAISIVLLLLPLLLFKYSAFIASVFSRELSELLQSKVSVLVPLGISFYTFQSIAYMVDIHNGKIERENKFLEHALFICFFPQVMAGPINRAGEMLPQINSERNITRESVRDGFGRFVLGLFKKAVIADGIGVIVDAVWIEYTEYSTPTLILCALLYSLQLYFDFAGYSDMALASGKIFGFSLRENFLYPYFAKNFADFWKRWHISLSSWLQDYLFTPLVWSRWWDKLFRKNKLDTVKPAVAVNILIIFLVSGIWHGAGWTFVVWGLLHGIYRVIEERINSYRKKHKIKKKKDIPHTLLGVVSVYLLATIANVLFRAPSIGDALAYFGSVAANGRFTSAVDEMYALTIGYETGSLLLFSKIMFGLLVVSIIYIIAVDYIGFRTNSTYPVGKWNEWVRFAAFMFETAMIFLIGQFGSSGFIYFNF